MTTVLTPTGSPQSLKKFFVNAEAVVIMDLNIDAASAQEASEIAKQAYDRWCDDVGCAAAGHSDAVKADGHVGPVTNGYSEVVHLDIESPVERTWEY